jgi:hypothetical protein
VVGSVLVFEEDDEAKPGDPVARLTALEEALRPLVHLGLRADFN